MGDFESTGVKFPDYEWDEAFVHKQRSEPEKKKAKTDSAAGSNASPTKSASSAVLSTALRKRLSGKSPQSKGGES